MSATAARRSSAELPRVLGPAAALAVLLAGGWIAVEAHGGHVLDALPDTLRAGIAVVVFFAVTGYPVARALAPAAFGPHFALLVLPVGAAAGSLALTLLGFLQVPFAVSLPLVLAAGAVGSVLVKRPIAGGGSLGLRLFWPAWLALAIVALTLLPAFRVGTTSTIGENPDAHLVTGAAEVVRHGAPASIQPQLPVDRVSGYWQSKYPIYYSLAAASSMSGLDPIRVFPVLSGVLLALFGVAIFLLAFYGFGAGPITALVAMGVVPLDRVAIYVAVHPYYNQLWGTFAFPFMLLFGFRFLREPGRRSFALFLLFFLLGVFAYPLMLPFPAVALGVAAYVIRRRKGEPVGWLAALDLPSLPGRRVVTVPLAVVGGFVVLLLALAGLQKGIDAAGVIVGGSLNGWQGDSPQLPFARYFGVPESTLGATVGLALVAVGLALGLRRLRSPERIGLAVTIAGALVMAANFASRDYGEYFEFKVLAFLGPIVLALAIVGLAGTRKALGTVAVGLLVLAAVAHARPALDSVPIQVPREMFELRTWSGDLPRGASIRLDVPPSGQQMWAAYMLHRHPLSSPAPLTDTTYPHVPRGRKADYVLVSPGQPRPRDALGRPLFRNDLFRLYRMDPGVPGPDRSSRTRIQPS